MRNLVLLIAVVVVVAAGCGGSTVDAGAGADIRARDAVADAAALDALIDAGIGVDPRPIVEPGEVEEPPTIRIVGTDVALELEAWTTCWVIYCADGAPGEDLELVRGVEELFVEFPTEGWVFSANSRELDAECGRQQSEQLEKVSETVHRLVPHGSAGSYEIDVFGSGPGGDVIVTFRWETSTPGVMPVPDASISILVDHDGQVDSYGVEFPIWNLRTTPESASATVVVTSADGATHRIEMAPNNLECALGDGALFLTAPISEGLVAAALGKRPFTYDITIRLDSDQYMASAVWPDDVHDDCRPCVPLSFDPPLPALASIHRSALGVAGVRSGSVLGRRVLE